MADTHFSTPLGWGGRRGLGHRMHLALGGLVALTVVVLLLAIVLVSRLAADQSRLNDHDVAFATATSAAALEAKAVANDERGYLISGDRRYVDEATARIAQARSAFADAEQAASSREQQRLLQGTVDGFDRWVAALQHELATYEHDRSAATSASLGTTRELRKAYEASLTQAQSLGSASVSAGASSVSTAAARSTRILFACLVFVALVGTIVSCWVIRSVAAPLHRLATILTA